MDRKHVIELVSETVTNSHHHRFFAVVNGTLALIDAKKTLTSDGTTRWEVRVNPEERCPLKPFVVESVQLTPRAVADDAAEEFMERMRGKLVEPPSRDAPESILS